MTKLSEFTMNSITGESVDLAQFDGQVALIVNVASN
jgi:glutathione peroxidase-family protein